MSLFLDILWTGWPLWVGLPWTAAWASRLREEAAAGMIGEPREIGMSLLYFAEGDVLRALVLLEGESHPLCVVLSGFWKGIVNPRQWEGIALVGEAQRRLPSLLGHLGRARQWVQGTGLVTIALTLGWLLWQRPAATDAAVLFSSATGGVLVVLCAFIGWWLLVIATEQRRLQVLRQRATALLHQSIDALDHGRLGTALGQERRTGPLTPGGTGTRRRNIVTDTYRQQR